MINHGHGFQIIGLTLQLENSLLMGILFIRKEILLYLNNLRRFSHPSFWFIQTGIFLQTRISTIFMHARKKMEQSAGNMMQRQISRF